MLWGVDELLTYHYLVAEALRVGEVSYEEFWRFSKTQQADLIWRTLFVERTPLSEATRGVVTTLQQLGPRSRDAKFGGLSALLQGPYPDRRHRSRAEDGRG